MLVIRGEQDRMLTRRWAADLAGLAPHGTLVEVPGPHTFLWRDPEVWSEPIHQLAVQGRVRA